MTNEWKPAFQELGYVFGDDFMWILHCRPGHSQFWHSTGQHTQSDFVHIVHSTTR